MRKDEEKVSSQAGDIQSTFDMEACLIDLAQRQIDLEDEEADVTSKVTSLIYGSKSSYEQFSDELNLLRTQIERRMIMLKRDEEDLMPQLFWLNSSSSSPSLSPSQSQVSKKVQAIFKASPSQLLEQEAAGSQADFPICSALSPSAKAIKIPLHGEKLDKKLSEKRLSLDSGYAESNLSCEEHHHPDPRPNSEPADFNSSNKEKKLQPVDLVKNCQKCQRKMSVKFDFDKLESEGDPEAWVIFNCSMCTSPNNLDSDSDSESDSLNDAITDQFGAILQDVTVYYTKKLDMYRIKMEHHQRTRPDRGHYELAFLLMELYSEHPNCDELWKDMFCRILGQELAALPIHATSIQRWMQEELQIKAAMKACINDLRRERDKVKYHSKASKKCRRNLSYREKIVSMI